MTRAIALSLILLFSLSLPAFAALARLSELSGDVQVLSKGQGQWHPAHDAEDLSVGDSVRTGAKASALLLRQDGTTVELMPFAQVTLESEEGFMLAAGRLWSHFAKAVGLPFFVRTPNATALIRGTTLAVAYEAERSHVVVYEGLVEVRGGGEAKEYVPGGFRIDVDRQGRLERLERAEARELDEGRLFRMRRGLEGHSPDRKGPREVRQEHPEGRSEAHIERTDSVQQRLEKVDRKLGDRIDRQERREARDRRTIQDATDRLIERDRQRQEERLPEQEVLPKIDVDSTIRLPDGQDSER